MHQRYQGCEAVREVEACLVRHCPIDKPGDSHAKATWMLRPTNVLQF